MTRLEKPRTGALPALVPTLLLASLLAGCASPPPAARPPEPPAAWAAEARGVAGSVPPRLMAMLTAEIAKGGPEGAIAACREQAPAMARKASEESGWSVRRVSLRQRNPKAVPDAWERSVLADFDRQAAAGAAPATLEKAELVQAADGRAELRYMKALPVVELCTACHGTAERLSKAVVTQLRSLYPQDQGVGYRVGEIRGAITLRKPAP